MTKKKVVSRISSWEKTRNHWLKFMREKGLNPNPERPILVVCKGKCELDVEIFKLQHTYVWKEGRLGIRYENGYTILEIV